MQKFAFPAILFSSQMGVFLFQAGISVISMWPASGPVPESLFHQAPPAGVSFFQWSVPGAAVPFSFPLWISTFQKCRVQTDQST